MKEDFVHRLAAILQALLLSMLLPPAAFAKPARAA